MPYVICILFIILYYGVCLWALCCNGGISVIKGIYENITFSQKIIIRVILAATLVLTVYWIRQNCFVYYWDYSGYWTMSISRMEYIFNNDSKSIFETLFYSINNDDYNMFLPTIVALPLKILGYTYLRYVVINHIMFLLPSVMVQALCVVKLIKKNRKLDREKLFLVGLLMAAIFPANYIAMYRGYIDVAILLPISILLYLFLDRDFTKVSLSGNISMALLLIILWISRRYTIYFIIGFVVAMLIKALAQIFMQDISRLKIVIVNFLLIGGVSLGGLFILFKDFVLRAMLTNYGEMYSAYDAPISYKVSSLGNSFGYVSIIILLITGILCLYFKRNRVNYFSLVVLSVVETIMFWNTQTMGDHHKLILNMPIYLLCLMQLDFWDFSVQNVKRKKYVAFEKVLVACSLIAMIMNFSNALIPKIQGRINNGLFSMSYTPLQRSDIATLNVLKDYLNTLTYSTGETIYVAASGPILNCDILRKLEMPFSNNAIPSMVGTADIDLRDGFPSDFLKANYIVTTDPVQLHLSTGQEVVSFLANEVNNSKGEIGEHFSLLDEFILDDCVMAKVYRKALPFDNNDLQYLSDYYMTLYPDHQELFQDRIFE